MQTSIPHYDKPNEIDAWVEFAASALRGLMSKVSYVDSKTFHESACAADRMIEELRKRTDPPAP